ncbi:hypothetical protein FOA43_000225 [Brettanomyces nanus]|uniref:AP-3 complex subunit delta n=1 Tax=Eeniella nana TaxID=13502 RepID=A0A875RVI2_EENNA|nr:uncharacterized protein FOA43_000225 [Brettanomyces nanus]QPG72921.1 hypothetical protein FOA43_000225 [Brettanomyces nanus]
MSTSQMIARLRPFGINFDKSLEDLIKGIRANGNNPEKLAAFLDSSIQECKNELKTSDIEQKSMAILKLTYLEMYGFDMSWCSFYILEVLSSSKFQHKRIGYLAAIQIMQRQNNDDALMLMTNQLKKDLNSSHSVECGLAIGCIASIVTTELAHDICDDLAKMLNHSKPLIRKRAVLAMYKVSLKYPEALRMYFDQLVDKLDDTDNSVVSATVNVICELAHANPKNYIELTPKLYGLMKDTNNNWMCIRLLKLFSSLSLVEPRLKHKLLPEIVDLMCTTDALSLVYECINAILNGNMLGEEDVKVAELIVNKLLGFFKSDDQNLKYVCLLAFIKTCRIHKELIKKHDKILLSCLYDVDLTIRETSLEIVNYLVSEKNIITIVTRLLLQLIPYSEQQKRLKDINNISEEDRENLFLTEIQQPVVVSNTYKFRVIEKILEVCCLDNYNNIPNFHWYMGVLRDIIKLNTENEISKVDEIVTEQFIDMSIRVPSIRPYLIETCLELCIFPVKTDEELLMFRQGLSRCIWIIGEYYEDYWTFSDSGKEEEENEEDDDSQKLTIPFIISEISKQDILMRLAEDESNTTVAKYTETVAKLFSKYCNILGIYWSRTDFESASQLCENVIEWLEKFRTCTNFEAQERAVSFIEMLKLALDAISTDMEKMGDSTSAETPKFLTEGYNQMFEIAQIKPISKTMQQRILVPSDLDLSSAVDEEAMSQFAYLLEKIQQEDAQLEDIIEEEEESDEEGGIVTDESYRDESLGSDASVNDEKEAIEEDHRRKEREERMKDDPYYITEGKELTIGPDQPAKIDVRTAKKNTKPRKIRREKVLVLEEEDSGINDARINIAVPETAGSKKRPKQSKFMVDSSNLEKVDLHAEPESTPESVGFESYEIEQEVEELRKEFEKTSSHTSVVAPSAPTAAGKNDKVTVTRKKPKKRKVKRTVPVIRDDS